MPYCPEQNGRAEIVDRILIEEARAMLAEANLDPRFWAEALNTACKLKNISPTAPLEDVCPEEAWSGKKPNLQHLRVFGCLAYGQIPEQKRKKWNLKAKEFMFVGYCDTSKAYRLIPLDDFTRIVKCRDVVFDESRMAVQRPPQQGPEFSIGGPINDDDEENIIQQPSEISGYHHRPESGCDAEEDPASQTVEEQSQPATDASVIPTQNEKSDQESPRERRSERVRQAPSWQKDYVCSSKITEEQSSESLEDPASFREAISGPDAEGWRNAMEVEMEAHKKNGTWELIDRVPGEKVITSKWVYRVKKDSNGNPEKLKARLVARGCSQVPGVDFEENFSPVVRMTTLRTLFACAARNGWPVTQLDVETAYLHGDLGERIIMQQPEGFERGDKVCLLKKPLYGLRQAGRLWFEKLCETLNGLGLQGFEADPCLFYLRRGESVLYLTVYVDDFLIFTGDEGLRGEVVGRLSKAFPVKDLGLARFCLGIQITQVPERKLVLLDQKTHIIEMLRRFNLVEAKPSPTPMEVGAKLVKRQKPIEDQSDDGAAREPYREAVGCLIHLSQTTRPDLCHAVSVVSQFCSNPAKQHWVAVKRIMRYAKGTQDLQLRFNGKIQSGMVAYSDADWGGCSDCRKSTTGYAFLFAGGLISWNSRKQPTVALSSTEAEYMAMSSACQEIKWFLNFSSLPGVDIRQPFPLYCDNQGAIQLSANNVHHKRTKHIDLRHHFIRQMVSEELVKITYVETDNMLADIFTKSLCSEKFVKFRSALGLM